jgi:hypothetical protein
MDGSQVVHKHLEKIMSIDGFCEMERDNSEHVFLFLMGTLKQPITAGQQVAILDVNADKLCDTYIAGITVASDEYSKVHRSADKGEQVQMIVGTNYKQCPALETRAKYLCAIIYDD